ncbi:DUF4372 domain-containing protein [Bacillus sp. 2205SS5-2]|uniref:DUF4372 domain-containing protein n=1 Tax=Bacillus sp. 2205SS5-2 TaxID=3109031 RepID=UPI0030044B65
MDKNTTKSTISELVNVLDEKKFLQIINVPDVDRYVKKLTTYKFFQLFLIAQLTDSRSLNRLEKKAKNKKELQLFMEFDTISASQLSRKQGWPSCYLRRTPIGHKWRN